MYNKYIVSLCDARYDTCVEVKSFLTPMGVVAYIGEKCTPGYTVLVRLAEEVDEDEK